MGSSCAPELVGIDHDGVDVIFRQPTQRAEVQAIQVAAANDPFDGYGRDGNAHWTLAGIREWWRQRDEIDRHVESSILRVASWRHPSERPLLQRVWESWRRFLNEEAAGYLRRYAHFVEYRAWPAPDASLPEL